MTERALIKRIKEELTKAGAKVLKIAGGPRCEAGTPDLIGCYCGRAFAIEAKVGKNVASKIQTARMNEWLASGACVAVAREMFAVAIFLEEVKS